MLKTNQSSNQNTRTQFIKNKLKQATIWLRKTEHKFEYASILIFGLAFITKILGFLKLRLIATIYGASRELDIFWASFAIPDLIFMLIIGGSTNAALIPAFIRLKKRNPKKLRQVFNLVLFLTLTLWLALWLIITLAVQLGGSALVPLVLKVMKAATHVGKLGFKQSYYMQYTQLFANLTSLMFLSSLLLAVSSVIGAYLLSFKRFVINNLSPLLYNLGIILGLLYISATKSANIYALAFSIILGSLLHFLIQAVFLIIQYKETVKYLPKDVYFVIKKQAKSVLLEVKHIFTVALPRMLGIGVEQISVFFNTFWALLLGGGALSIFKYALSLHFLPIHLIGNTVAQAVFPSLNETREGKKGKKLNGNFTKLFHRAFLTIFLLTAYTAAIIFILKTPIITILLGGGKLDNKAIYITSLTLGVLSLSIILNSLLPLVLRVFYVLEETKTPLLISLMGVIMNILFGIALANLFGYPIVINSLKQVLWNFNLKPLISILPLLPKLTLRLARGKYSIVGLALGLGLGTLPELLLAIKLAKSRVRSIFTPDFIHIIGVNSLLLFFSTAIGFFLHKYFVYYRLENSLLGIGAEFILLTFVILIPYALYNKKFFMSQK